MILGKSINLGDHLMIELEDRAQYMFLDSKLNMNATFF